MIELGRFGRPHGVRGAIHLRLHNDQSVLLKKGRILQVGAGPGELQALEVVEVRRDANGAVIRFAGHESREAASSLNGMKWFESREAFPPPPEGEYYHVDLIGLTARLETGEVLGQVIDVLELPASDVLLVQGDEELMIPFVENFLVRVELAQREIVIRDVPGLRDAQRTDPAD